MQSNIEGAERIATLSFTLESGFSGVFALVQGGWFPSGLGCNEATTVLLDFNLVYELIGRFDQGKPKSAEPDLLHLITGWPVRINPILYATEGKDRRFPTQEELRTRLEWATAKLKVALPDAVLVVGPEAIAPAIATLEATRNRFEREQDFLVRIAPLLSSGVNEQNRRTKWNEVLAAVRDCHLSMRSLVVTLALSSVMVPNGGPAKLLKFRAKYTEAHAYNALADLRALEYLMCCFAMFPEKPTQFWTRDKALVWFWCGMQASKFEYDGNAARFNLSPKPELFPGWAFHELPKIWEAGY